MWILYFNVACVLVFWGLLAAASVNDVRRYRIPNWISVAIAGLYLPFALSGPGSTAAMLLQGYGVGLAVMAVGFLMFMGRIMGGGDAKLLSAAGIWAGTAYLLDVLLIMAATGGLMALAALAWLPMRKRLRGKAFLDKVRKTKLPYGVAISAGGFWAGWQHLQPALGMMGLK